MFIWVHRLYRFPGGGNHTQNPHSIGIGLMSRQIYEVIIFKSCHTRLLLGCNIGALRILTGFWGVILLISKGAIRECLYPEPVCLSRVVPVDGAQVGLGLGA